MGKKFTSLIFLLLVMLLAPPLGRAATETVNPPSTANASQTTVSGTNVTLTVTAGTVKANYFDFVSGNTLTVAIASGYEMTGIEIVSNGTGGSYKYKPSANLTTVNTGTAAASTVNTNGVTWSGKATSVTFTATGNARFKGITVTYQSSGSTGPTQLSAPDDLSASNETDSSIDLSWTAVSNASSYTVSYTPTGGTEQTVTSLTGTSTTLTGLTSGTTYSIKIKAVGDGTSYSDSDYSSAITASTTSSGGGGSTTYELVTDASTLKDGDEIIIVNAAGTYGLKLKSSANQEAGTVTVSGTTATPSSDVSVITLGGSSGSWSLSGSISGTTYYLHSNSDAAAALTSETTPNTEWSITISSDANTSNYAAITSGSNTRSIGYNSGANPPFRQYAASNSTYRVKIYKKADSRTKLGTPSVALTTNGETTASLTITPDPDDALLVDDYTVEVTPSTGVTASVSDTTVTLTGLTGGTAYTVSVVANPTDTDTYKSSDAGTTTFTTLTKLATPTMDSGTVTDKTTALVAWNQIANASSYKLYYKASSAASYTEVAIALSDLSDATSPDYLITGLTAGTTYSAYVVAIGDGTTYADSDAAAAVSFTTEEDVIEMYMLGQYDGNADFVPNRSKRLSYDNTTGLYSTTVYFNDVEDGYAFFSFATNTTDLTGDSGWAALNRVGANSADYNTVYTNGTNDHGDFIWLAGNSSNSFKIGTGLYLIETGSPSGDGGSSPWTGNNNWKMFIHALTLDTPANVAASDTTTTSFNLTWDAVPNAVGYKVFVDGVQKADVATNTAHLSDGISAAHTYSVTVQAYAGPVTSTASTAITVSTKPGNGTLKADGTTVSNDTSADPYQAETATSFTLTGKSANATQYYSIDGGTATEYTVAFNISTTGAHSITYYSCYNGLMSNSATRYVTIASSVPPTSPTTVTTADVKDTRMTINWTAVGDATGYKLTVATGGTPLTGFDEQDMGTALTATITGLTAETSYTITVTPYNGVGDGTPTTIVDATTPEPNNVFEKAESIAAGDEIIFVYEDGDSSYAMGYQKTNNRDAEAVEVASETVTITEATSDTDQDKVYVFTVEEGTGDNAGNFAFKSNVSGKYLYAASSSSNHLKEQNSAAYWSVDLTTPTIVDQTYSENRNHMRYNPNNGTPLFSCYADGSSTTNYPLVAIYKRSDIEKDDQAAPTNVEATNVTWNGATISWDAVGTATNGYVVTFTPTSGAAVTIPVAAGTTSITTTDLTENTNYTVTVRANATATHNKSAESTVSAESTFKTATPTRVTYDKVTAEMLAASDADQYSYIFVAKVAGANAVMAGEDTDTQGHPSRLALHNTNAVVVNDELGTAAVPRDGVYAQFTIEKDGSDYYFFDGTGYLAWVGEEMEKNNVLYTVASKDASNRTTSWTVDATAETITSTNTVSGGTDGAYVLQYNKSNNRNKFRAFKAGSQTAVWLYRSQVKASLGSRATAGYIDVPVNIVYVDNNGIAYGCASAGINQITDGNASEKTSDAGTYSDDFTKYDQRDWVAIAGLDGADGLVGKTISEFAGTIDATKPGYYFTASSQPTSIVDTPAGSVPCNEYQVHNLVASTDGNEYVRPQVYEYTETFYAALKNQSGWKAFGIVAGSEMSILLDTSLFASTDDWVESSGQNYNTLKGVFTAVNKGAGAPPRRLRNGTADLDNQEYRFRITEAPTTEDVPTGVQTLRTDDVEYRLRGIYNLQGQRVRETVPGQFYIINGKKTMVNSVIRDTDF